MHLFYKKKKPKYLNLYFGFFFSLPPAVSIRIPLLSMLMTRCRAMQPKHNCALQASLHALLCFVCAPFSFFLFLPRFPFAFRFSSCSWRAVALYSQSTNCALQASLLALLCFVCAPLVGICKL